MVSKKCRKCGIEKPIEDFYKNLSSKDGVRSECKICNNLKTEKCREKNPKRIWCSSTLQHHQISGNKIEISIDNLYKIVKDVENCEICGEKLDWNWGKKKGKTQHNSPTLDRKNNENLINQKNIMIICHRCNKTKQDRNFGEFICYCKKVIERFGKN